MWLDNFNKMRKSSGMSLDEISAKSGIPKGTLAKITSGVTKAPPLETMRSLVYSMGYTLDDLEDNPPKTKKSPSLPDEAMKVAARYSKLDRYGKATVQAVIGEEEARVKEQAELDAMLTKPETKIIPLYLVPAAAGYASPIFGSDYDNYELTPEDPQGAVFAIKVQGDSMEPHFPDGSIAFCNHDAMADGDIGVFCLDGESFIKQYHYDRMMGMTYLFSLNRSRADADKLIVHSSGQTLTCMGRVITRRRHPLPM